MNAVDLAKIYAQLVIDVNDKAINDKCFVVADIVVDNPDDPDGNFDWKYPYDLVYYHYEDKTRHWKSNWHAARTQLGKIINGLIPQLNRDLDISVKSRKVDRKGHPCTEYYFDIQEDNPISKNKALLLINFFKHNPCYVSDVHKYLTYAEGAAAIGWHHRPMQWALGYIQTANQALGNPPLQMLFVRGDTKEPGDSFDWKRCGWTSKAEMLAKRTEVANHVWDWDALATYIRCNL